MTESVILTRTTKGIPRVSLFLARKPESSMFFYMLDHLSVSCHVVEYHYAEYIQ